METITKDPVCGMDVARDSAHAAEHDGKRYLFCSAGCLRKFQADPGKFTSSKDSGGSEDEEKSVKKRQEGRGKSWRDYVPLMVLVALTLGAACAKQYAYAEPWNWSLWMHDFMGFFLIVFSMFKFFNLEGFADGFQMYDLLAKPFRPYAYLYPFLELALGLSYLAWFEPTATYIATVVLMIFGSLGVFRALMKGLDLECACMGTVLSVPLSTVALIEDLGMAAMALVMLFAM